MPFLVVPFSDRDCQLNPKRDKFNKKLRTGRSVIEADIGSFRSFLTLWIAIAHLNTTNISLGQFKHRFPVLLHGIHCKSVKKAGQLIVALAAINNFIVIHSTPQEIRLTVIILIQLYPFPLLSLTSLFFSIATKEKTGEETKKKEI